MLIDPDNIKPGRKMGEPVDGAIAAMQYLKRRGHTLLIHTVRGGRPEHVADWLKHFEIPYDRIEPKVFADLYLDNNAVHFESWRGFLEGFD